MVRAILLALVALASSGGASVADPGCFLGPERIDKGLQRYYVNNECGVPVELPYRVREYEGGDEVERTWTVPACLPVKQGIAFTQWAEVEFLPPRVPGEAPKKCTFASAHPRADVDVPGALDLLGTAVACAIPEERDDDEGMVTLRNNKLFPKEDFLVVGEKKTVAVTQDIEIWKEEFNGGFFVSYSQLASATADGSEVAFVCADGAICIKRFIETQGDCGDFKCEHYEDVSSARLPMCDAATAANAVLAIEELMRANKAP